MKAKQEFPETLREAIGYFADADNALGFMKALHWPDGKVSCPDCQSLDVAFLPARRFWQCHACRRQFSAKIGTIFEESPLGFDKWLPAAWMIFNAKNGISSCELARALGVTQKTAWFMLHRIRLAIQDGSLCKFAGNVEVDETFIGGKARKMNKRQRRSIEKHPGPFAGKVPVQGILQRNTPDKASRVALMQVRSLDKGELQGNIKEYVLKGSQVAGLFIEITPGCLEAQDLPEGIQVCSGPIAEDASHLQALSSFVVEHRMEIEVTLLTNVLYDAIKRTAEKYGKKIIEFKVNRKQIHFDKASLHRRISEIRKL